MQTKIKILLWAPFGAGTHYWGPGTSAFRLYQSRERKELSPTTLVHGNPEQGIFRSVYKDHFIVTNLGKANIYRQTMFILKSRAWLSKHHKQYDVFHGIGGFEMTMNPALAFVNKGKPAFLKITGRHGGYGHNSMLSRMLGISRRRDKNANQITGYIAISREIERNLLAHGVRPEKIHLIPNGVDTAIFHPVDANQKTELRRELGIANIPTFVMVGGLTDNKQQYTCALAIVDLLKKGYDIQLLLVGPDRSGGVELAKIQECLDSQGQYKDKIVHVPFTKQPAKYYQLADYYLLASRSEGMPNALLEAMACKLPCIVTPVSGCQDLIQHEANGITTGFDIEAIGESCEYYLNNTEIAQSYGEQAYRTIQKQYASSIIFQKHIELFRNTM